MMVPNLSQKHFDTIGGCSAVPVYMLVLGIYIMINLASILLMPAPDSLKRLNDPRKGRTQRAFKSGGCE
jgi:hypothetical protein